jgi:hypothetical protein
MTLLKNSKQPCAIPLLMQRRLSLALILKPPSQSTFGFLTACLSIIPWNPMILLWS